MKFRYKVLMMNILLLSLAIGISCIFVIDKNMNLALDSQIKSAVDENNILQASVEYQLLGMTGKDSDVIMKELTAICEDIISNVTSEQSDLFVLYDGVPVYSKRSTPGFFPDELWQKSEIGKKNYIIMQESDRYSVYTTSCSMISGAKLNIISKHDITEVYTLMGTQIAYYRFLLLIIISTCSVIMFLLSYFLTKPLESLNRVSHAFGKGDYTSRATVYSNDEIGMLANTYNQMAQSVYDHVEELEQIIKKQDQFVSDFSHELKTPMTSIIGYADMLQRKEMSRDNQILAASYIFNEGKRLELMSQKLFDLIYTKQHAISHNPVDCVRLFHDVEFSVSPSMKEKHLRLHVSCDEYQLTGDADLLKSALINLLDNARKASKPGSKIRFIGQLRSDDFLITVQDFGIGIEAEHLAHIADEFYMVDKSRSRQEGGAGLGLSLSVLIFHSHNAELHIESTPGVGTTITISFKKEVSDEN